MKIQLCKRSVSLTGIFFVLLFSAVLQAQTILRPTSKAIDVSIGPEGSIWVIDDKSKIKKWTGSEWVVVSGEAQRIAVSPSGQPWVINQGNSIFEYIPASGQWQMQPGKALDIAVSYRNEVWVAAEQGIFQWNPSPDRSKGSWIEYSGVAQRITVDPLAFRG
jgi:hypothetical protein